MTTAQHADASTDVPDAERRDGTRVTVSAARVLHAAKDVLAGNTWLRDALFAAVFLAVWWAGIGVGLALQWRPVELGHYAVVGFLAAGALAFCRRYPVTGLAVVAIATAWPDWWFEVSAVRVIPLVVAGYLAAAAGLRLLVALPLALAGTVLTLVPVLGYLRSGGIPALDFLLESLRFMDPSGRILSGVLVVAAVLLGRSAFTQRRAVEQLADRNAELERLREADIERIATEERAAIAREIHDVVAHHVSAMVIRAQAADRVAARNPEELRETVRWVARNGQEALAAMRHVVKVLRADAAAPADSTSTDFVSSLEVIISRVREAGLRVDVSIDDDLEPSTVHELAVLRIVQEALTNVLLHSSASSVTVAVFARGETLQVRVEDDGAVAKSTPAADHNSGSGVRGMRERAEAAGGSLRAGRGTSGGWLVEAVLPLGGGAA